MSTLHEAFAAAKAEDRAALVGYLPAGFPAPRRRRRPSSRRWSRTASTRSRSACPTPTRSWTARPSRTPCSAALEAGHAHRRRARAPSRRSPRTGAPTLVMTYWNPIERYGVDRFASDLAAAGGIGVITPDLTPEEAGPWIAATDASGIDRVFLVAPSLDRRAHRHRRGRLDRLRLRRVDHGRHRRAHQRRRGRALAGRADEGRTPSLPVAVGVGVSTGAQAAEVAAYADGVIVGSAFVRPLLDARHPGRGRRRRRPPRRRARPRRPRRLTRASGVPRRAGNSGRRPVVGHAGDDLVT